jgi:hypothetical protein
MKSKHIDNIEVLDMLLKTEQFLSLKDEIIKDSLKAILSCLKIQNDKINTIDKELYNKINREEFNKNIKTKVNFSDFMKEVNELKEKEQKINFISNNSTKNNYSKSSIDSINKDIQNLKLEYSIISKKFDNIMMLNKDNFLADINYEKENKFFNDLQNKIEKNETDITNLTVDVQNKLIKIDDGIENIKMNQMNKNEINKIIIDNFKKYEEISLKNIENEFMTIKNNINKQITDTFIDLNQNNTSINNQSIKMDLLLKEINSKLDIYDETIKEMSSKFHKKLNKEEIVNIYQNIEEIKNDIINQKNEIKTKIEKLNEQNNKHNYINNENENIINYFEKEIKSIKMNINDNYNEIKNIKQDLINTNIDINNNFEKIYMNKMNNSNNIEIISDDNLYPKNDIKNEIAYLKRFINTFMLEVKNENKRANDMLLNLLKEKMNINDINKILNQISKDLDNKVDVDKYNNQLYIQKDINNYICKEHILGRWISYKNTTLKHAFIIWNKQLINLAPNNYCFTPNNTQILIKENGLYLIKIIIFNGNKQRDTLSNVQLIIDRKKIYNYSYINKKIFINDEKNNDSYEESMIFEECISVNKICRVEVRLDGFNHNENDDNILENNQNNIFNKKEKINAILNIISL